jgi:putative ABC transport system ATP-binding protein
MKKQKKLSITPLKDNYFENNDIEISLQDVDKIYRTKNLEVHALSGVNLDIMKGELVFIIGPSGSGKTTIIKLVTGMEPCSAGRISVLNKELQKLNDAERAIFRRDNIGIVSQQGDLHPFITVTENLFLRDILSRNNLQFRKFPQEKIEEAFTEFQIEHRKDSYPLEVSGGELQRASLAIANFGTPGFLILDEPTANMDAELAANVMDQLYKIHKQLNITLLITTHDINLVRDGTRVIELRDGKIFNDGQAITIEEEIT